MISIKLIDGFTILTVSGTALQILARWLTIPCILLRYSINLISLIDRYTSWLLPSDGVILGNWACFQLLVPSPIIDFSHFIFILIGHLLSLWRSFLVTFFSFHVIFPFSLKLGFYIPLNNYFLFPTKVFVKRFRFRLHFL